MKKKYQTPSVKVMHVELGKQLMAGSGNGAKTNTFMSFGGDADSGVSGDAKRSFSVWDDDEEE